MRGELAEGPRALRGLLKAADQADEGGLARAVAAYEAVDGSLFHVHGQAVEGLSVLIMLDQVPDPHGVFDPEDADAEPQAGDHEVPAFGAAERRDPGLRGELAEGPRQQSELPGVEGLGQIVGGSALEQVHLVLHRRPGGEDDHRYPAAGPRSFPG